MRSPCSYLVCRINLLQAIRSDDESREVATRPPLTATDDDKLESKYHPIVNGAVVDLVTIDIAVKFQLVEDL